jgi:hypothetical protein
MLLFENTATMGRERAAAPGIRLEGKMKENEVPFFAKYLEGQQFPQVKTNVKAGEASTKYPSDKDEMEHTLKYPSDGDEGV